MICKQCGQFNEDDKKFCTNCGTPLERAETAASTTTAGASDTASAPHPQFKPLSGPLTPVTTPPLSSKNAISKEKTVMFWASKAALILALVMFFLPFMKISFSEESHMSAFAKPIEMTGRELVFGIDDDNDANESTSNSLSNGRVILAAIILLTAIAVPRGAGAAAVASDILLLLFVKNADKSYTFMKKTIRDWDGLIDLNFQPAMYAAIILIAVGSVLAFMDESKRKKMYIEEQSMSFGGGYM